MNKGWLFRRLKLAQHDFLTRLSLDLQHPNPSNPPSSNPSAITEASFQDSHSCRYSSFPGEWAWDVPAGVSRHQQSGFDPEKYLELRPREWVLYFWQTNEESTGSRELTMLSEGTMTSLEFWVQRPQGKDWTGHSEWQVAWVMVQSPET